MMIRYALVAALLATAPGIAAADSRTQLEKSLRIPVEEAGQYSGRQLVMIKRLMERSDLNDADRQHRINQVKAARSPLLSVNF